MMEQKPSYPSNPFRFGCGLYRLYELLKTGKVTTNDIARIGGHSHTRRISDLRSKLERDGWTVKSKPIGDHGNGMEYEYWIGPCQGELFLEAV